MTTTTAKLLIKPLGRHHGLFLCLVGSILLLLTLFCSHYFWLQYRMPLMLMVLISVVIVFIGSLKLSEPQHSFILTPQKLHFARRYGYWQLKWSKIKVIKQVTETCGIEQYHLPYIGIALTNITAIANNISPRLASRLLHEQRPLLAFCLRHQLIAPEQSVINFDAFTSNDGYQITGPVAAFLHHTKVLHHALGYHLYIPETALDRDINDFVTLLKNCQASNSHYLT